MSCSVLHSLMSEMEGACVATTELPDAYEEPDRLMDGWYLKLDVSTSFAYNQYQKENILRHHPFRYPPALSLFFCLYPFAKQKKALVQLT